MKFPEHIRLSDVFDEAMAVEIITEGMFSGMGKASHSLARAQQESWGGSVCLQPTHTADPWDTEPRGGSHLCHCGSRFSEAHRSHGCLWGCKVRGWGPAWASLRPKGAVRISPRAHHPCCSPCSHFSQVASSEPSGQSGVSSHSRKPSMQQPLLQRNWEGWQLPEHTGWG